MIRRSRAHPARPGGADRRGSASAGAGDVARLALLLGFVAAPVVGDIGSCGQEAKDLDPYKFFVIKDQIDCQRCQECGLVTEACARACEPPPEAEEFPEGCYPLIHDGEVCLNALLAASCSEYEGYTADASPTTPTECNFCPLEERTASEGAAGELDGEAP
jgi:hypothetical protein